MRATLWALLALQFILSACGSKSDNENSNATVSSIIIGSDDRTILTSLQGSDKRTGLLLGINHDGTMSQCSGALIGERQVLTAAHCLYDQSGVKRDLSFIPGALPQYQWKRRYRATKVFVSEGYLNSPVDHLGHIKITQVAHDLAVVELEDVGDKNAGNLFGHHSIWGKSNLEEQMTVQTVGYPKDKELVTPIKVNSCKVAKNFANVYLSDCDIIQGQSGSAVVKFEPEYKKEILRGVVSATGEKHNYIVILKGDHQDAIQNIKKGQKQFIFREINVPSSGTHSPLIVENNCERDLFVAIYAQYQVGETTPKGFYEVPAGQRKYIATIYGPDFLYFARDQANSIIFDGNWLAQDAIEGMSRRGYRLREIDRTLGMARLTLTCR